MNSNTLRASLLVALALGCSDSSPTEPQTAAPSTEVVVARELIAARYAADEFELARELVAPLIARADAALEDLVRAAIIDYRTRGTHDPAHDPKLILDRIAARDPEHPALHYMLGRMAREIGDSETAVDHFRRALAAAPDDVPTMINLSIVLTDVEQYEEAEQTLAPVIDLGIENAGSWYITALFRMRQLLLIRGEVEEAQRYQGLYSQYDALGFKAVSETEADQGNLARIEAPEPQGFTPGMPATVPTFTREDPILAELAGSTQFFTHDVNGDTITDIVAAGPNGLYVAVQTLDGFRVEQPYAQPVDLVRAFDLGNDDALDFMLATGGQLLLIDATTADDLSVSWAPAQLELPAFEATPADMTIVDFDHDGDLDFALAGSFGARLLRNDGARRSEQEDGTVTRGTFTDVSAEAGLPTGPVTWCATEDIDADQDVDLLFGGPLKLFLLDNLRGGKFRERATEVFPAGTIFAREPVLSDWNGDARPDVFSAAPSKVWWQRADGKFSAQALEVETPAEFNGTEVDLDLDGSADVVWQAEGVLAAGVLTVGLETRQPFQLAATEGATTALALCDIDRDLDVDVLRLTTAGVEIWRCTSPVGNAARLGPLGRKDNRRAVGAIVEVRAGALYRRIYWRGERQLLGMGEHKWFDVVRITWPNGVEQSLLDIEPIDQALVDSDDDAFQQKEGLIGSCPFLYTWDGTQYAFISDVLGITPLGLPMAPGLLVPPDHDEYVLVRGSQLLPKDGVLELQFTEELREVTYLDRIRLDVVDHPAGSAIYPNERFTFPPFPEHHIHTVTDPLSATRVTGSDGADWTQALATLDDVHAAPFEPLAPQFLGLATPHWLELEFDKEAIGDATKLRLVLTGWFYWTDASVNMASARTPGVDFVPPLLQVPGPEGEWVDAGPPIGFPAGKTKTMVIDVTDVLSRDDPRLRLFSTLRLYWDVIELAVDDDDAELALASLEPKSAHLWSRGFSQSEQTDRDDLPERFEWDRLEPRARWNQHPGMYTRFGDALELVTAIDDRFVIMGSGDALTVQFDASELPPLREGFVRDYLVFMDGWAKDRDPNTVEALHVEPLPFHGMSGYPYGPDEAFPDTPAHRAWRSEWNTRPGQPHIPPLSPTREAEWLRQAE